jgi:predicted phosphodiesterase
MRIALISDIHANLPALEAVLESIDSRGAIAATYHLGDLVGYAPWPNETVDLVRARGILGIAGNYDSTVATDHPHCGCRYENEHEAQLSHEGYTWTQTSVSAETKAFLAALPFRLDLRPRGGHAGGPRLCLVHGTPTLNTLYWTEGQPDSFCTSMAARAGLGDGDVIGFGHTHKPWHRIVEGVHFVNTGSVGRPKDSDWRAGYVTLDLGGEEPNVEFHRVEYDLERAVAGILSSSLPNEFADVLRSGGAPKAE